MPELSGAAYFARFPGRTPVDFGRWKYFSNPAGEALVGIGLSGDRVVSIAAAVPKLIQVGSSTFTTYELGDFITADDFRKRGLFSDLINMVCDEAARRGAPFVYVRPNPISFPILANKLHFYEAAQIDQRRYVVPSGLIHRKTGTPAGLWQAIGLDALAKKWFVPSPSGSAVQVQVEPVSRFSAEVDDLWESVRNRYSFALGRTSDYLNWRFTDCPTPYQKWVARRDGKVVGYLVAFLNEAESTGYLIDHFAAPDDHDAVAALLLRGFESMLAAGAPSVCCWTVREYADSAAATALTRACPVAAKPHLHFALRVLDKAKVDPSSLPATGWQLAIGDFDGV